MSEPLDLDALPESYGDAIDTYLQSQSWITTEHLPLVFHVRKLARLLDTELDATRGHYSAYLQAVKTLQARDPSAVVKGAAEVPGQTDVFDFLASGDE